MLRAASWEPGALKPSHTVHRVIELAARDFGVLALGLLDWGADPREAVRFLMQLLFCLFTEDIGIPRNRLFSRVLEFGAQYPARFNE